MKSYLQCHACNYVLNPMQTPNQTRTRFSGQVYPSWAQILPHLKRKQTIHWCQHSLSLFCAACLMTGQCLWPPRPLPSVLRNDSVSQTQEHRSQGPGQGGKERGRNACETSCKQDGRQVRRRSLGSRPCVISCWGPKNLTVRREGSWQAGGLGLNGGLLCCSFIQRTGLLSRCL